MSPRTRTPSSIDALDPSRGAALPESGEVRVGPLMPVADLLREHGADPAAVLMACGLPADALADADRRISFRSAACLAQRSAWTLQRPDFGLLVGQRLQLTRLGLLGELMRQAPTVGAALHNMGRYFHLQDRGSVPYMRQVGDGVVALGYSLYDADIPGVGLAYDMVLAMMMSALRALGGPSSARWSCTCRTARRPRRCRTGAALVCRFVRRSARRAACRSALAGRAGGRRGRFGARRRASRRARCRRQ